MADLPGPEQTKAFPVPADDGRGFDDKDAGLPVVPDGAQPGPQQAIRRGQFGSFDGALENAELMAESEDLELKHPRLRTEAKTAAERADNRCPPGKRRGNGNSQFINQIGVCENHTRSSAEKNGQDRETRPNGEAP